MDDSNRVIPLPSREEMLAAPLPWEVCSEGSTGVVLTRFATVDEVHSVRWPRGSRVRRR